MLLSFIVLFTLSVSTTLSAQCSICTKTASQLGEKQGKGLNGGIIYLMLMPFAIGGYIGYRWWKNEKVLREIEAAEDYLIALNQLRVVSSEWSVITLNMRYSLTTDRLPRTTWNVIFCLT